MRRRDALLAVLPALIWGFGFVVIKIGVENFSAPQLTALRFLVGAVPVLFVPRPRISWLQLVLIGLFLFTGQFLLLFSAFAAGLPAGLASVTQQSQVFFTVLLAAVFLRDRPSARQTVGMVIAFSGLVLIAATVGGDLPPLALGLALAGAFSWAIGNILVKRLPSVPVLSLVVWASLIPPLPALLVSALEDQTSLPAALAGASWLGLGAVLYLGLLATVLGYAIWGDLLQRYPAARVAPFALLAPCVGVVSSTFLLSEVFSPLRYAGMALILAGLAVIVLAPAGLPLVRRRRQAG
ncbi:MAG: EamA family transporter [Stellaceae bacterium]